MMIIETVQTKNINVLVTQETDFRTLMKTVAKYFMIDHRYYGFYSDKYSYISENLLVSDYFNLVQKGGRG